jgi:alkylhydroperoxidase family enzyme
MSVRIAPASPPYPETVQEDLSKLMPGGLEPIALFRTLAKNPRVLRRFRRGVLLDPGSITLRQRELVILRTTALAGAEYEWGVHVQFFGSLARFDADCLYASVWLGPSAACWKPDEALLIRACDELHATARLSDGLWAELRAIFAEEQLLELLVLAGLYRTISYVVNGTGVALERAAPRFPQRSDQRE